MEPATVHVDGGSRGNPGPAAYAFVLRRPGHDAYEECDRLGTATNNVAEYTALIQALTRALSFEVTRLTVFSDSELMVKQMQGLYKVKSADLQPLYRAAEDLRRRFEAVVFNHVARRFNADADRLCNEALDGRPRRAGRPAWQQVADSVAEVLAPPPSRASDAEAVACLENAARSWAERGPHDPDPAEVWQRLRLILARHAPAPPPPLVPAGASDTQAPGYEPF